MGTWTLSIGIWIVGIIAIGQGKDYTGYKLVTVDPQTESQLKIINDIEEDPAYEIDFWGELVANHSIDLLVPPHTYDVMVKVMDAIGIPHKVSIDNVQWLIDHENDDDDNADDDQDLVKQFYEWQQDLDSRVSPKFGRYQRSSGVMLPSDFEDAVRKFKAQTSEKIKIIGEFARHNQINDWLDDMSNKYGNIASVLEIGTSYEGRSIKIIKIGSEGENKQSLWIDAGIHAREWIAPATAIYIIDQLLLGYGKDPTVRTLVEKYDWYILPVVNPDGYEYTFTGDRLWRKNRTPSPSNKTDPLCVGTDLNRNFGYKWNEACTTNLFSQCRTADPCKQTYGGSEAFSEPEARAVRDFIWMNRDKLQLYLSLHSYMQLWLTPWGCCTDTPEDEADIDRVVRTGLKALVGRHGTSYFYGSPAIFLYPADGNSYDWARAQAGIQYSFVMELRDRGSYGFLVPKKEVIPVGEEIWAGIKAVVEEIAKGKDERKEELEEELGDVAQT